MTNTADAIGTSPDDVLAYPMPRAQDHPFDPPPQLRALQAETPLTRVRLWDGSTPWLVAGTPTSGPCSPTAG